MATHIIQTDSRDNVYVDVENIRVSYIESNNRAADKDWPGTDVLRIQSYRGDGSSALHRGAELPIYSKASIDELISALEELKQSLT